MKEVGMTIVFKKGQKEKYCVAGVFAEEQTGWSHKLLMILL